jgi:hypothetical protein
MTTTCQRNSIGGALAIVALLTVVALQPASALIDPDFTPINLWRNVGVMAQVTIGPLAEGKPLALRGIEPIKGEVPAGLALDTAGMPDKVRDDLDEQLGDSGAVGVLLLSNIGYSAMPGAGDGVEGAVLIGGKWFALRRKDARTFGIDADTLNLRNVWAGSAEMLVRCLVYIKADPAASIPVASGMHWAGERKLDKVEEKVTGAYAVDLFGDGKPCLLVTALTGDRLYRAEAGGAMADVTARTRLAGTSRYATFGDYSGDGRMDIMGWDGAQLVLTAQAGDGALAGTPLPVVVAGGCLGLAAVDGGDGRTGVLVATESGPVLVRRDAAGPWRAAPLGGKPDPTLGAAGACIAADLDGDGMIDVLQLFAEGLRFHKGTGPGAFAAPVETKMHLLPNLASPMVGDFDADGLLDVVAVGTGGVVALRNLGRGRFADHLADAGEVSYDFYNACHAGTTCDVNGDGRQEFFLMFPANYPQFFLNRGFFTTGVANDLVIGGAGNALTCARELGAGQQAGVAADFDGDGGEEMALAATGGSVWLLTPAGDAPRMSLSVALPANASGPVSVVGYDGLRCLGARLAQPGVPALFGKVNKGPLRVDWRQPGGRAISKLLVLTRSVHMVARE